MVDFYVPTIRPIGSTFERKSLHIIRGGSRVKYGVGTLRRPWETSSERSTSMQERIALTGMGGRPFPRLTRSPFDSATTAPPGIPSSPTTT